MYVESIKYPAALPGHRSAGHPRETRGDAQERIHRGGQEGRGCPHGGHGLRGPAGRRDAPAGGHSPHRGLLRISILAGKVLSMSPLPAGNRVAFLAPSGAMLVCLSDLSTRLGLAVPELEDETLAEDPTDHAALHPDPKPGGHLGGSPLRGDRDRLPPGHGGGARRSQRRCCDPDLHADQGDGDPGRAIEFVVDLADRHPAKPVLVSFTGDKRCMDECRDFLEPRGVPTFIQIEEPFLALSILSRCAEAAKRP